MHHKREQVTLIGAGLAGSLLAIFLAKRGFQVEVYERRPDPRHVTQSAGRSINLALSTRGIYALEQVGLAESVLQRAVAMPGRMIHTLEGEVHFQPYGQHASEVLYAISRADLNRTLLHAAEEYAGVRLFFNQQCIGVQCDTGTLTFRDVTTGTEQSVGASRIIGTDGSASVVRTSMLSLGRFNYAQHYLEHGYKELTIPSGPGGAWQIEPHALHIWPRGTYMFIALPNLDGSFTCTLFFPFEGHDSFATLTTEARVHAFFARQFPDVVGLIPELAQHFVQHPTGALVTIKCLPWHASDTVLLLGDAAHAIVPFFGQGMNCAFEDCTELDACITQYWPDWTRIFQAFTSMRKVNTDAIADMAIAHYQEMRDQVADPRFLLQKQVELALERKYPTLFFPRYSMVTFHRMPYAVAQHKGVMQERILETLCASIETLEQVDWDDAERLVMQHLQSP